MLPRPINGLCLSPFKNGPESPPRFLVEAGARSYVVSFRMRVLIEALQQASEPASVVSYIEARTSEVVSEEELLASIRRLPPALFDQRLADEHQTPITCRVPLIPARVVQWIAAGTGLLFSRPVLVAGVSAMVVAAPFACRAAHASLQQAEMSWGTLAWLGLGLLVSAIAHELGHASAVARSGAAPGHIGFGLYWLYPVFYTDVNAAWKLAPGQRVMVDVGGIYFQLLLVTGLTPLAFSGPAVDAVRLLLLFNLYSILQNLNPVFKLDGYWILADVARIPNLHARTFHFWRQAFRRNGADARTRLVLLLYGLAVGAYSGYVLALLPGAIRLQLLPRLDRLVEQLVLCAGSLRQAEWTAAFGQLGLVLQAALGPAVVALMLGIWVAGLCRRPGTPAHRMANPARP